MVVYSFLIFDRHTTCCYYHHFSGRFPAPGPATLPGVYPPSTASAAATSTLSPSSSSSIPPPWDRPQQVVPLPVAAAGSGAEEGGGGGGGGLAFDEEARLIYGIIFSLRNMAKKLSGRTENSFHSFSTTSYKLHYLHTPTSYHLILLTSPTPHSLQPLLQQIYAGPFLEYVVRNPLVELDSEKSGKGVDCEAFRRGVERLVRGANV